MLYISHNTKQHKMGSSESKRIRVDDNGESIHINRLEESDRDIHFRVDKPKLKEYLFYNEAHPLNQLLLGMQFPLHDPYQIDGQTINTIRIGMLYSIVGIDNATALTIANILAYVTPKSPFTTKTTNYFDAICDVPSVSKLQIKSILSSIFAPEKMVKYNRPNGIADGAMLRQVISNETMICSCGKCPHYTEYYRLLSIVDDGKEVHTYHGKYILAHRECLDRAIEWINTHCIRYNPDIGTWFYIPKIERKSI
jgi:hypothetical protein